MKELKVVDYYTPASVKPADTLHLWFAVPFSTRNFTCLTILILLEFKKETIF
jgi:hypothetical protein